MICSLKSSSSAFAATTDLLPPKSRMTPTLCFATLRCNSFSPKTPSSSLSSIKPLYLTPLESFGSAKPRGMSLKAKAYEADRSESVAFPDHEARAAAAQKLKIGIYFATWWALNVVFNIYNKKVLNAFPYPWLTSTLSLAAGSLIMLLSWAARVTAAPKTDLEFWKALAPVAVAHTIGHVAATVSMSKVAVSFTHIIKSGEPAFSVLVSRFVLGERFPVPVYLSLVPIIGGCALAALTELNFDMTGFMGAMISNLAFVFRNIFSKRGMKVTSVSGRVRPLCALFLSLLFLVFLLPWAAGSSPLESSHLYRVLHVQERERLPPAVQVAAARGLLARLLPFHVSSFELEIVSKETCGGAACFIISNHPSLSTKGFPEILIQGTSGVELSAGLHWYLKHWCLIHISWEKTGGLQLSSVPKVGSLPHVPSAGILVQRPVPLSYYQNAVTSSYSYAWWSWERWEKEIDWMVLQGVNLPLAFNGQEAIWQKVFERYNISRRDLDDFFGGPAFLSWSRMGNLHGWGGPLPQSWLDDQLVLQKKILARMYSFGMTPVLPAFSGNVPSVLKSKFPSAKITHLGNWFTVHSDPRWCCTYLLDATDPLFIEIGKAFMEQQLKEYGRRSHIYNCDTFDENTPPVDDPKYISSLGSAIYKGMQSGDDDAIWLMQGWLFSYDPFWKPPQMKALLHSVPIGRMVVLDLFAEVKPIWITSKQFYGVPYIWCMLHNFAGNIEMYGILDAIALGPIEARTSENSTMVGVGMSMEGIEQNPVVYDLMSEMAFHHKPVDVKIWVDLYATRRYGRFVPALQDAWQILYHTLYNCTDGAYDKNRDVIVAFPDVDPSVILIPEISEERKLVHFSRQLSEREPLKETANSYDQPHLWYSTADVTRALVLFLENGYDVSDSQTFRYDLVDLTRQALAKYANKVFLKIIEGYKLSNLKQATIYSQHFLDLVKDLDMLLSCHDGFLLGPWLESAKRLARDPEQEQQFEWNARTQVTMWFDNTETEASLLRDYGNKYWSGLLLDYYGPRASIYFKYMIDSLVKGESFPLEDWRRDWIGLTNKWQSSRNLFPVKASGDALNISRWLYDKYLCSDNLQSLYMGSNYDEAANFVSFYV